MSNNAYTIISLFYNLFILIIYFSKKKIKNIETTIYSQLLILNTINVVTALACFITILNRDTIPIVNDMVSKFLLVCFLGWVLLFTKYIFTISYNIKSKIKITYMNTFLLVILFTSIFLIPVDM